MSNLLKSKFFLGVMMVVAFAFVAVSSASAAYMHTVTLKQGSSGSQVMELQKTLGVGADGAFGPMTKAAVMSFQSANGLTADGVVGPMTGAKLAGGSTGCTGFDPMTGKPCGSTSTVPGCMAGYMFSSTTGAKCDGSTTGSTGSTDAVTGGAGSITVDSLSTYSNEDVGEGDTDVKVLAFTVEADDNSDVGVTSVKVELKQTNSADSRRIEDYVKSASIWMGGKKVGEADASDFSESSHIYTKSIALTNATVKAGDKETFVVALDAQSTLDSGDTNSETFAVDVLNVRFKDGEGVVTTEDTDATALDQSADFGSFADANSVELKAALVSADDEINEAHVIDVDDTNDTSDESLLSFSLKANGDSDINVSEIPVYVTVTGAANVDDMITGITLWHGGEQIGSESVGSGVGANEAYTFNDLDVDVKAGDTEKFMVKVDLKSTADVDLDNGDTIKVELDATRVDLIVATDESGDDVTTTDLTGTALGEASAVYDSGISVKFLSSTKEKSFTADAATEDDQGTYKVKFSVTAFDGDMYIDNSSEVANANAAGQGVEFSVTSTAGTPVLGSDLLESDTAKTEDTANAFFVEEGTTREFTLTVIYSADSTPTDGSHSIKIDSINWGTASDDTNANYYEFNLGDFKTDALFLNGIA